MTALGQDARDGGVQREARRPRAAAELGQRRAALVGAEQQLRKVVSRPVHADVPLVDLVEARPARAIGRDGGMDGKSQGTRGRPPDELAPRPRNGL